MMHLSFLPKYGIYVLSIPVSPISVVAVSEEGGDVGEEDVGGGEGGAVTDQVAEPDVADDIVAVGRDVLLVDVAEGEDGGNVGDRVAHIDTQGDVGRVGGSVEIAHLFVFIAVVVAARHDIAQNRGGGGKAAGPFAEHELAVVAFAADNNAVILVVDTVDVARGENKFGHYKHGEIFVGDLYHLRDELDFHTFFTRITDVAVMDGGDAVGEHIFGFYIYSEGVDGNDDELEKGVETLDVKRRVALGKSQFLSTAQRGIIRLVVVKDSRQNIVGRAVENAFDFEQQVVVIVFFEVSDDGDGAARRCVVKQGGIVAPLQVDELGEVAGNHRLVAAHDGNALGQGAGHDGVGRVGIVDDLDNEVNVGIVKDVIGIIGQQLGAKFNAARLGEVADTDAHNFGMGVFSALYHPVYSLADHAEPEQSYFDFFHILC